MENIEKRGLSELSIDEMQFIKGGGPITEGAAWVIGFVVTLAREAAESLDKEFGSAPPSIGYIK